MRIIIATNNNHKVEEFKEIIGKDKDIYSFSMLNIHMNPEENGTTLEENAKIKVRDLYEYMKENKMLKKNDLLISDDTGLFIDYLDGAPGIYSARFVSEKATSEEKNKEVLKRLKDVPKEKRTATFMCVIASIYNEKEAVDYGELKGYISEEIKDMGGFGYDPIFVDKESGKTYSAMGQKEKNKISHRFRAWQKLKERYKEI